MIRVLSEPPWARWFHAAASAGNGHRVNSPPSVRSSKWLHGDGIRELALQHRSALASRDVQPRA